MRPYDAKRALLYAFLLWILGFVWGTFVFMIPALKGIEAIPHISKYPAISVPLILLYALALYPLTRRYLTRAEDKSAEGMKLGMTLSIATLILDAIVYLAILSSHDYFTYASIWISYALLAIEPWLIGMHAGR